MAPHLSTSVTSVVSRRVTDKVCVKKRFAIDFPKPSNGAWIFLVVFEAGIRARAGRASQQKTEEPLPDRTCPDPLLQSRRDAGVVMKMAIMTISPRCAPGSSRGPDLPSGGGRG